MKRCPECRRDYYDDTLLYCLDDGNALLEGPATARGADDGPETAILSEPGAVATGFRGGEDQTRAFVNTTDQTAILQTEAEAEPQKNLGSSERQSLSAQRAAKPKRRVGSWQRQLAVVGIAVVLLVGGFFGYRYFNQSGSAAINSIAVMPFENRNSDADTDYLSDGLAESVIFRLTQIPDLKVSPTSSVMRYKGKETDVAKIASELGVDAVMTGRLTKRGDNLNITVELVDARTNNSLWGEQYERKLSELLTTQRDIVTEIVGKLQLKLSGESEQKLAKKYTDNNEAYQLYLQGRYHWNKRTGPALKQAVDLFKQAIEKDPNFALAYSGLAETYVLFSSYGVALPKDSMPQAKGAALRALELDDSLAEAHTALAEYLVHYEFDRVAAEREFRRAIDLNPKYPTAHQWLGNLLSSVKRFDESLVELKRAEELDPLSPIITLNVADTLVAARRYDEGIVIYKRLLSMNPDFALGHFTLGIVYGLKGMYGEALAETRKAFELDPDPSTKGYIGLWLARSGDREGARKLLEEMKEDSAGRYVQSFSIGMLYLGLGDKDRALDWLEKEVEERGSATRYYATSGEVDELQSEPRFKAMLKQLNLPE